MRAGRLRERVDLQSVTRTADSWGDAVDSWANYATSLPATISPISGKESVSDNKVASDITHIVYIRYSSDVSSVSPTHRVKYGSRYFDIQAVINKDTRNRMLELHCTELLD